jgi:hypothetical protein
LQSFLAITRRENRVPFESQCYFKQFEDVWNIFNDQDWAIKSAHSDIVAAFWMTNKSGSFFAMKLLPLNLQASG